MCKQFAARQSLFSGFHPATKAQRMIAWRFVTRISMRPGIYWIQPRKSQMQKDYFLSAIRHTHWWAKYWPPMKVSNPCLKRTRSISGCRILECRLNEPLVKLFWDEGSSRDCWGWVWNRMVRFMVAKRDFHYIHYFKTFAGHTVDEILNSLESEDNEVICIVRDNKVPHSRGCKRSDKKTSASQGEILRQFLILVLAMKGSIDHIIRTWRQKLTGTYTLMDKVTIEILYLFYSRLC